MMMLPFKLAVLLFQIYPLLFLPLFLQLVSSSSSPNKIPRLSPHYKKTSILRDTDQKFSSASATSEDNYKTYYYTQTLDHFNYGPHSYATFEQKYVVNFKNWGGPNSSSPIFAYLGAEAPLHVDVGFITDNAPSFKALAVYIEHRFYGKSIPFGSSMEKAMKNKTLRGYFNSAQAIADYAEVLLHVKHKFGAHKSPIIVIGGSYGGSALASSAPILYFDNITPQNGYYSIVTKDFKEASHSCYQTIRKSWSEIDKVASKPNGLSILSKKFKTCSKLNSSMDLKDYLDAIYSTAAQYNFQLDDSVGKFCKGVDGAPKGTDVLGRIFNGVVSVEGNYTSCYDTNEYNYVDETELGWRWQGIKLVLHRFGSNIIFSNGLKDPYSSGGVLEDISDSIVAVTTLNGSHCIDLLSSTKTDPEWLTIQRNTEVKIIKGWIKKYYADLHAFKERE
ncbi:hypothetical protein DH2020_000309 [Rehmannia glutinosa]|uniref:Uncharacterized protein n=1 Tax=Rehmannia glutinosa TaxID=99300 RepID=A0ABR0XWS0_REHGL